jgi:glycosyltransferase involved in cell wall biosynthesis
MSEASGLEILVEVVQELKHTIKDLRLHISGGRTGDDRRYLRRVRGKIRSAGIEKDVLIFHDFSKAARADFFKGLTLFCVPSTSPTAFGLNLLEAMAAGIPVVQPDIGSYPEILESTGGGIVYEPNDAPTLAAALKSLLTDRDRAAALGRQGQAAVRATYSLDIVAEKTVAVYRKSMELR